MAHAPLPRRFFASLTLLLSFAGAGWAQTKPQIVLLTGTIHDQTGAAVAGAEIVAAGEATTSDAAGTYTLHVPAGLVRVEVNLNHQTSFRVSLDVEQERTFDIALKEGDSVTVPFYAKAA